MKKLFISVEYTSTNSVTGIREFFMLSEAGSCNPIDYTEFISIFPNNDETNLTNLTRYELPILESQDLPLYDFHTPKDKPRVFYYAKKDEEFRPKTLFTFFTEYPILAQHLKDRDFVNAAKLLARSENLLENIELTKYILKDQSFLALCFYWMADFSTDKDEELSFLLQAYSGSSQINLSSISYHGQPYARLLKYAQDNIDVFDFSDFRKLAKEKITNLLKDTNAGIILPVTGLNFFSGLNNIINQVHSLTAESLKNQIIQGIDETKTRAEIRQYFENFSFSILPEPNNSYDPNAIAVILKGSDEINKQVGYIKREFAAILSPLLQKGLHCTATLFNLTSSSISLNIKAI